MEFDGKVALVTGASSGIGRETALALARAGALVVVTARRVALLQSLVEQCRITSPDSFYLCGDISDRAFAESLVHDTVARCGRIDILVNNAAAPMHRPLYDISVEDAEELMRLNFLSCLWTTFAAIPQMLLQAEADGSANSLANSPAKEGSGTIVNVSSIAATVTPTHETIYAASKGAMNGFTQGLWNDLAGSGIHCALVVPGPIDTEIWHKFEDEQAYSGKKYPASLVAEEILVSIQKRRFEVIVPRHNPSLLSAKFFANFFPSLIRKGVARMNPVSPALVRDAISRARKGLPMGHK